MMLLRSVNHVRVVCGHCQRQVEYDDAASAGFMSTIMSVAQQYRKLMLWTCDGCKRDEGIDVKRAQTFLRLWTI